LGVWNPFVCPTGLLLHVMGQEHKEYTWNLIAKKLVGEATPEELRELEALLRSNPELHYPMQTITDLWNTASRQDRKMAEQAFNSHLDRMRELKIDFEPAEPTEPVDRNAPAIPAYSQSTPAYNPSFPANRSSIPLHIASTRRQSKTLLMAATFCGGIILAIVWLFPAQSPQKIVAATPPQTYQSGGSGIFTGSGSRTHLALPDGTIVWLNAGSRINYEKNFGTSLREVTLTGEAFFDVAPNANKPFVIHTARIDIRVLGTSFNVKSYPTDKTTEATLIRGSIEVSIKNRPREKIILKPNEKITVANEEDTLKGPAPAGRHETNEDGSQVKVGKPTYESTSGAVIETSWKDNKLIFQDEEFSDLAKLMERWYGVVIRFSNPKEEELRFTGIFTNETIQQALDALKLTGASSFDYTINENTITIHDK